MTTSASIRCHCGFIREPAASLLASHTLPADCDMCHCNICRHTTGALGASYLALKGAPGEETLQHTTGYKSSEKYTRYFCTRCGCNVFARSERDGRWLACAGALDSDDWQSPHPEERAENGLNVSNIGYHEYVGDAADGGIASFLTRIEGRNVPCYVTEPKEGGGDEAMQKDELVRMRQESMLQSSESSIRGEYMEVSCHCRGVQFRIVAPAYTKGSEGWYVPADRSKYYARICCCRSCRLTLGVTMQPWTYIPPSQIFTTSHQQVVFGPEAKSAEQFENLKYYQSSEFVLRSFCATCGATMFYQSFERPYIIDVSVGVVRSRLGNALAREWLEWDRSLVSKRGEAVDDELVEAWLA